MDPLKYIYRLAIGTRGGRHIHILINREANEKTATDLIITDLWEQRWGHGHVNSRTLYSEGGYRQLAIYITKPLEKWESHPSRNLIRKDPETEEIKEVLLIATVNHVRQKRQKVITWIWKASRQGRTR